MTTNENWKIVLANFRRFLLRKMAHKKVLVHVIIEHLTENSVGK